MAHIKPNKMKGQVGMKSSEYQIKKYCILTLSIYVFCVLLFWGIAKNELNYKISTSSMLSPSYAVPEISEGIIIEQNFIVEADELLSITLQMATFARDYNKGMIEVVLLKGSDLLSSVQTDVANIQDNSSYQFLLPEPVLGQKGEELTLRIVSNCKPGYGVTVMYGNSISTVRGEVATELEDTVRVNGEELNGRLCFQQTSRSHLWYGSYYWVITVGFGILLTGYLIHILICVKKGETCSGLKLVSVCERYGFLMHQLVSRDFKNKYKRSVLGMLWSFLNPLLTMLVQYFVFSNIFKTDTENFVVYLLTGIVFFNFYSEASNMAMSSIVGNSALITKVYVPKYIYPLSRVLSSGVNFLISLVPLIIVIVATHVAIKPAILLVVYPIICNFILALGIGLILSSIMVFFRDTQFIYGVLLTALMYFTPIFYPITIIPERFRWLFYLNPVSNNIVFARSCILDGVFPGMKLALLCGGVAVAVLAIGATIFKRTQDRFILHI